MAISADEFKTALRRWASGVTIVTARAGDRIHGMTVSAFSAVSLDPPLVLVCADKGANTTPLIAEGGVFAANVLAAGQEALSNRFASKKEEWRRFEGLEWGTLATGAPILPGVLAALDCRLVATHDAGDHLIYVGSVEAIVASEQPPLIYFEAAYHQVSLVAG